MRFIDDDIIFTIDEPHILALLQPQFGRLTDLGLLKSDDGFTWHAFNARGHTVSGTITIRMTPAPEGIEVWLETGAVGAPMQSSTMSHRVASRFARERGGTADEMLSESLNLILADGGVVTARDVERLLVPQFGKLTRLGFKASPIGALVAPNSVAWEAVGSEGERVEGALVLHAAVANDHVEVWTEVTVNRRRPSRRSASEHHPSMRLRAVGRLARDMIARIRRQPTAPWIEVVAGLVRIVEVAESDDE